MANLAVILAALTQTSPVRALAGLNGAQALKSAVIEAVVETLRPVRAAYSELAADPIPVLRLLREHAEAVRSTVGATATDARLAMGLLAPGMPG